ncbi:bifunctional UDP-N-acetylglucosamine diphosphorylase/glucosamine-1-phosphate N-acetyltransferase GlmU [Candidatus Dependentiae bacterium]
MKNNLQAVILAAGKSTRFNTENSKLLEKICGQPMVLFPTKLLEKLGIDTTLVVGYQNEMIEKVVSQHHKNVTFVHQKKQLGTGHAVACTKDVWEKEHILILNGDMPLVTTETIKNFFKEHIKQKAAISIVGAYVEEDDHAYGRIIEQGKSIKIVEAKDFEKKPTVDIWPINAGIYLVKTEFLRNCIDQIDKKNKAKEFYITSLIEIAFKKNLKIATLYADFEEIRGVNTLEELAQVEEIKRYETIRNWMKKGVRFNTTHNAYIDIDVHIGAGTTIEPGVHILSGSNIEKHCKIRKSSTIENSVIEDNVEILQGSIVRNSHIGKHAKVGPFAHIHTESAIGDETVVGNFVEIKKSKVAKNTCVKHLSYLGNATIGSKVNIGAGTITCNYDGFTKHETIIKDNAFIGSNNTLVAPLKIEQHAFTAAGSTITEDVGKNSLAIARARQITKQDYVQKLLEKLQYRSISEHAPEKKCRVKKIKKQKEKELG